MGTTTFLHHTSIQKIGLEQAHYHYDESLKAAFFYMNPSPRPCFNLDLLKELKLFQQATAQQVRSEIHNKGESDIQYTVLASSTPGTYNLGGDLNLFLEHIRNQDRDALLSYAITCIDIAHEMASSMALPITTTALVQGSAQGGGFEAALSCNVIIAEKGTQMGFPEVLFNLFPGMGAYTFLRQRVNATLAERIILSGKIYQAEELYELGIINVLTEPGKGEQGLRDYIKNTNRKSNAQAFIRHTRDHYNQASYKELMDITTMWVDSAMKIGTKEMKTMSRLVRAQDKKIASLISANKYQA